MKRRLSHRLIALCLLATCALAGSASAAGTTLTLTAGGPQPANVTIPVGQPLTITNADTVAHSLKSKRARLDLTLQPGETVVQTMVTAGNFTVVQRGGTDRKIGLVVDGPKTAGGVTLVSKDQLLTYGKHATISGHTATPAAVVTLWSHLRGERTWRNPRLITATEAGAFAVLVAPSKSMTYRFTLGKDATKPVTLTVRPVVSVTLTTHSVKTGSYVTASIKVRPAAAARSVDLKVLRTGKKKWFRVGTRAVDRHTGHTTIRWSVDQGRHLLRAFVSSKVLAEGYRAAESPSVSVTGVGLPPEQIARDAKAKAKAAAKAKAKAQAAAKAKAQAAAKARAQAAAKAAAKKH